MCACLLIVQAVATMSQCSYRSERRHILLLLLAPAIVIAQENRLVSNGTCYYAAGKQADSVYIPCGNDAFGVYACCMNGDVCLSSNACYNSQCTSTTIRFFDRLLTRWLRWRHLHSWMYGFQLLRPSMRQQRSIWRPTMGKPRSLLRIG